MAERSRDLIDLFSAMDGVMVADNISHGGQSNSTPSRFRTPSTRGRIGNGVIPSQNDTIQNSRSKSRHRNPKKMQSDVDGLGNSPKLFPDYSNLLIPGSSARKRDHITASSSNARFSTVHTPHNGNKKIQQTVFQNRATPPKLRSTSNPDHVSIPPSDGRSQNMRTEENGPNKVKNRPSYTRFGFTKLTEMNNNWDADKITLYICQNADVFETLVKEKIRPDLLELLLKVVVKMIDTSFRESKIEVYSFLCEKIFVEGLILYITSSVVERNCKKHEKIINFFDNLNLFFEDIINLMPYKTLEALDVLLDVEVMILNQKQCGCFTNAAQVAVKLKGDLELNRERWEKIGNDPKSMKKMESAPPDDFHDISLYPTPEDFAGRNFIRKNIVDGSYEDVYHYLDVQFRLLREDFIDPLRVGIRDYKDSLTSNDNRHKKNFNIKIYKNVKFLSTCYDSKRTSLISFTILLPQHLTKRIKWEYSKRLLFGSLVLFSRDHFETFQLATISDRDVNMLKQNGTVNVALIGENTFGNELFTSDFVMAESSAFFEPIYQVLKTIKDLQLENFPMERYFLVHDVSPSVPKYLIGKPLIDITNDNGSSFTVNINDDLSWPPSHSLNFNQSQALAFKSVMRNEFSVIQGPPGTGKTYLGLKIVKTILENFNFSSPILMVCYTNHALDQFLEGLLTVTKDIVRIGGQSKNEALNEFNYNNVRKRRVFRHPSIPKLKEEMTKCLSMINSNNKLLQGLLNPAGIIDILEYKNSKLHGNITFENSNDYLSWLLGDSFEFLNYLMKEYVETQASKEDNSQPKPPVDNDDLSNSDEDDEDDKRKALHNAYNDDELMDMLAAAKGEIHYSLIFNKLQELNFTMKNYLFELNSDKASLNAIQFVVNDLGQFQEFTNALIRRVTDVNQKPSMSYKDLIKRNIWGLNENDKWALYHLWIRQVRDNAYKEIDGYHEAYNNLLERWNELKIMEDYDTLNHLQPKILGLTTTGAARHHSLISVLKPPIIIVEEAAEVLEAHIVTALTPSCQHLILIGDHKQLKPNPSTFKLAKDYHLDISLFERMINNGVGCRTLTVQHRMKPNIASLIAPTIYPDLTNHSSVELYPSVLGVQKNLFFIDHTFLELTEEDMESKRNQHEAEFMIKFCRHLLLQGYNPSDITILTTYSGQQFCLRELKKKCPLLREVRMTVVDNYQGEECKIILLSLVRSNKEGKIGFLNIENRVCVALSRAKHGLYIIGNMNLLKSHSNIWQEINTNLQSQAAIGEKLSLVCQIHPNTITEVQCAKDFNKVPEGGCSQLCMRLMGCGHTCPSLCHIVDPEHSNIKCNKPCNREICPEPNHSCPLRCHEKCRPCKVMMKRIVPKCRHDAELECSVKVDEYKCLVQVSNVKPDCGHLLNHLCHRDVLQVTCNHPCEIRLDCGHSCVKKCHVKQDPDHIDYKCFKDCTKKNEGCKENHMCSKRCWEECGVCTVKMERNMPCGHLLKIPCFEDPGNVPCPRDCKKTLPCGHKCKRKCHEQCGGCKVKVEKIIPECGHSIKSECSAPVDRSMCKKACKKVLGCGHPCKLKCCQVCSIQDCQEYVPSLVMPACGHPGQVLCYKASSSMDPMSDELMRYCQHPCNKVLPCGDVCKGTCGNCMQGRIHQVCEENCGNILICGHKCTVPCREDCPPCGKPCEYRCKHSKCGRKCGAPCKPCNEPCDWQCIHKECTKLCGDLCDREPCYEPCKKLLKCRHPCVGFCGDPCPKLCRICDKEELTEVFFGTEDEEDARFVMIVDCGHILESSGLDSWLSIVPEDGKDKEIGIKTCPKCKGPIVKTLRYGNLVKTALKEIQQVKFRIFGSEKDIIKIQNNLMNINLPKVKTLIAKSPSWVSRIRDLQQIMDLIETGGFKNLSKGGYKSGSKRISLMQTNLFKYLSLCLEEILQVIINMSDISPSLVGNSTIAQYKGKLKIRVALLLHHLSRRAIKISRMEIVQFTRELNRFKRMVEFYELLNKMSNLRLNSVVVETNKIFAKLFSVKEFDDGEIFEALKIFSNLNKDFYQPVSKQEMSMVQSAMQKDFTSASKQGHWFQCPNGHVYVITECGGAMERGICPECKEVIGGQNHTLVSTSRLASQVDGATHAAWSERANMANYNL